MHRHNVVRKNKSGITALDYATFTDKADVSKFLAELFYDLGEDLNCADDNGDTLLHLLARKGDEVSLLLVFEKKKSNLL